MLCHLLPMLHRFASSLSRGHNCTCSRPLQAGHVVCVERLLDRCGDPLFQPKKALKEAYSNSPFANRVKEVFPSTDGNKPLPSLSMKGTTQYHHAVMSDPWLRPYERSLLRWLQATTEFAELQRSGNKNGLAIASQQALCTEMVLATMNKHPAVHVRILLPPSFSCT
jgi:hypothetical protein